MLLEGECTGQMSGSSRVLTTHETDWPTNTSALCIHPDRDAESMNSLRLSKDPEDMTGNNKHHPNTPTELSDQPLGMRD